MPSRPHTGGRVTHLHVTVTPADRVTLEHWLRSSRLPYGLHKRARAVLLLAEGFQVSEIARRVDMQRRHVYRWVRRFQQAGVKGLLDKPRHGPVLGRWAKQTREDNDVC